MKTLKALEQLVASRSKDTTDLADKIRYRRAPLSLENCYADLASYHAARGVLNLSKNRELAEAKNDFYLAGKLTLAAASAASGNRFSTGIELLYVLLSDSPALTVEIGSFAPDYFLRARDNPLRREFRIDMYQLAMVRDFDHLASKIQKIANHGRTKDRLEYSAKRDFFSTLIRGDREALTKLIADEGRQGDEWAITGGVMNLRATIEAKVSRIAGLPVSPECTFVPSEVVPIAPLSEYRNLYDFLAANYVPPSEGFWKRMRYSIAEKRRLAKLIHERSKPNDSSSLP